MLYRVMLRLRRFEEKAGMLYALGSLQRPCPLGIGQEGAFAGLSAGLAPEDSLLGLTPSPALALAFGAGAVGLFETLLPAPDEAHSQPLLLVTPGGAIRRPASLAEAEAGLAAAAASSPVVAVVGVEGTPLCEFGPALAAVAASGRAPLPVIVVPRGAAPQRDLFPAGFAAMDLREVDATDGAGVCAAVEAARADVLAGSVQPLLVLLTPPYMGHARSAEARSAGARPAARKDLPDPLAHMRRVLSAAGIASEAELAAIEAGVRDEMAAAGRALARAHGAV